MEENRHTLPKTERLHSNKLISNLFNGGASRAMTSYPIRMVFTQVEGKTVSELLISVPKRNLHRANRRNRVKRQIREAYRKHKGLVAGLGIVMAFIWLDNKLYPSETVDKNVLNLLTRVKEKAEAQNG